jgi:hypothetical protein
MTYRAVNLASQFGMPLYGIAGIPPFTGSQFWVNESTGSDGNTGGPQDPLATLTQALSLCADGNNDVVFLTGTVHTTATVTWSKNKTHLIGLSPDLRSQARARISQTGSTVFTPLVNVTASECIFRNIGSFHGFANASAQICWTDAGGRNEYTRCLFGGMGNATAAAQTGGRSLLVTGGTGENTFTDCQIGIDTVTRSAANASLELAAATPRNTFSRCIFPCLTSAAGALWVTVGSGGMDRWALFSDCAFLNAVESTGTTLTAGIIANAAAGGAIVLQNPVSLGATAIATTGPVYGIGNVPVATTSGIAIKFT